MTWHRLPRDGARSLETFHFGKQQYAATVARNGRYAVGGIVGLQTLPSRLWTEPRQVAAELVAAHRAAEARLRRAA